MQERRPVLDYRGMPPDAGRRFPGWLLLAFVLQLVLLSSTGGFTSGTTQYYVAGAPVPWIVVLLLILSTAGTGVLFLIDFIRWLLGWGKSA